MQKKVQHIEHAYECPKIDRFILPGSENVHTKFAEVKIFKEFEARNEGYYY